MSRIYEALQRAELEKHPLLELLSTKPEDSAAVAVAEQEQPTVQSPLDPVDIGLFPWKPDTLALPSLEEQGITAEQFRQLRSQVYLLRLDGKLKAVLVSSGVPGEGKSFIASNLALSLARSKDCHVLLIDGDLRRPSLHKLFGAPLAPGLTEYLAESADLAAVMQRCQSLANDEEHRSCIPPNLTFMPAGDSARNVPEIIGNHRFEALVEAVSPFFDWIIIDSPPVLVVADAIDLARAADAVLLVARAGRTPFDIAQRAQAALRNSRLLGFVLNAAKPGRRRDSYYSYYTGQESEKARVVRQE